MSTGPVDAAVIKNVGSSYGCRNLGMEWSCVILESEKSMLSAYGLIGMEVDCRKRQGVNLPPARKDYRFNQLKPVTFVLLGLVGATI
nr:hypothetical protein Itr_chr01CG21940 [Ipomoea trifida]